METGVKIGKLRKLVDKRVFTDLPYDCMFEISNYFRTTTEVLNMMMTCRLVYNYFNSPGFRGCQNADFFIQEKEFEYRIPNMKCEKTGIPFVSSVVWVVEDWHFRSDDEDQRNFPGLVAFKKSLKCFPQLKSLKIETHNFPYRALISIVGLLNLFNISRSLVKFDSYVNQLVIDRSFPTMANLENLIISTLEIKVPNAGELLPNLRILELTAGRFFDSDFPKSPCSVENVTFNRLLNLSIGGYEGHIMWDQNFIRACRNIEILKFRASRQSGAEIPLTNLDNNFPCLKDLSLTGGDLRKVKKWEEATNLTIIRIKISVVRGVSDIEKALSKILPLVKNLQKIDFDFVVEFQYNGPYEAITSISKFILGCRKNLLVRFCCDRFVEVRDLFTVKRYKEGEFYFLRCRKCIKCLFCDHNVVSKFRYFPFDTCRFCRRGCCLDCEGKFERHEIDEYVQFEICPNCQKQRYPPQKCGICSTLSPSTCSICKRVVCDGCTESCGCREVDWYYEELCEVPKICKTCYRNHLFVECEIANCRRKGCTTCIKATCSKCKRRMCDRDYGFPCRGICDVDSCRGIGSGDLCDGCFPKCQVCGILNCDGCTKCEKCSRTFCRDTLDFENCAGYCRSSIHGDIDLKLVNVCEECYDGECEHCTGLVCRGCVKRCSKCEKLCCTDFCMENSICKVCLRQGS